MSYYKGNPQDTGYDWSGGSGSYSYDLGSGTSGFGGSNDQGFQSFDYSSAEATSSVGYSYDRVDTSRAVPHGGPTGFEDEPPLLEELGINPEHIMQKTLAVLHPFKKTDATILQDTDMAGPIAFGLAFGAFLLISGKVHFGYIYGIGLVGCLGIYFLLNMMSIQGISLGITASILGYCLLPMVALAGFAILFSLKGGIGLVTTIASVVWCSWSASKLFVTALAMDQQQPLVAYPCALLYGVFALLTVF